MAKKKAGVYWVYRHLGEIGWQGAYEKQADGWSRKILFPSERKAKEWAAANWPPGSRCMLEYLPDGTREEFVTPSGKKAVKKASVRPDGVFTTDDGWVARWRNGVLEYQASDGKWYPASAWG